MANDKNKHTDPDYKPQRGQETNENWDEKNRDNSDDTKASNPEINKDQSTEQLPSEKRVDRDNATGPGLG